MWTLVTGTLYETAAPFIVDAVHKGTVALAKTSLVPGLNQFRYLPESGKVQVNVGVHPKTLDMVLTYRFCLASAPVALSSNLGTGFETEYDARLTDIGDVKLELDYENAGIALETNSSIQFENTDHWFDAIFDTLIWENQPARVYSWGLGLAPEDAKLIYDGFVDTKSYDAKKVRFNLKDQFKRLRDKVKLPVFSEADGILDESMLMKSKRRIYGRVAQLRTTGVDKVLDGFALAGTLDCGVGAQVITGTGTDFLNECSPDDTLVYSYQGTEVTVRIESVDSATQLTLSDTLELPMDGATVTIKPNVPYRKKNRAWHIAGHKLHEYEGEIVDTPSLSRVVLDNVDGLEPDIDLIIAGERVTIDRVSLDNLVVLKQALSDIPANGTPVVSSPLQAAYFGSEFLVPDRDYTVLNSSTDAILELDELAEFNIVRPFSMPHSFTFTNGSRTVTCGTAGVDLTTIFRTRDWIRAKSITRPTWFEILAVNVDSLILRAPYSEISFTGLAQRKNVTLVGDDARILVSCNGMQRADGTWIKNASRAIRHLLEEDLAVSSIADAAFDEAEIDAPQLISYVMPSIPQGEAPVIRNVITDINRSVFGALYQNKNFEFTFSVLQSDKDESMDVLSEDDVISYTVQTKPQIVNLTRVNYRPFVDRFTGESSTAIQEFENAFVDTLSRIENTLEVTAYLFRDSDAVIYAERLAFLRSVTNAVIQVKGKLNISNFQVGQKVLLNLDRLYKRYGMEDALKVAIVYMLAADESGGTLGLNDFNGMFTRVGSIAPNDAADFAGAEGEAVAKWGYLVDDDTETPDGATNIALGTNLIG